jgi:hypothetical protein
LKVYCAKNQKCTISPSFFTDENLTVKFLGVKIGNEFKDVNLGAKITFECKNETDFQFTGNRELTCMKNEEWNDQFNAKCDPKDPTKSNNPPKPNVENSDGENGKLNTGEIIGIVCGCVGGVLILAFVIYWFCLKKN